MKEKIGKNNTRKSSLSYKKIDHCLSHSKSGKVNIYQKCLISKHFRSEVRDSFQNFEDFAHLTSVLMNFCALPNL